MTFSVIYKQRDNLSQYTPLPLDYKVRRYSWNVIGGPKQAKIEAFGTDVDLWRLVEMVRCPIWIYSTLGDAVWWGYVSDIRLTVRSSASIRNPSVSQRVKVGVSADTFYNRIAVAYTELDAGDASIGERNTTAWADDDGSQDEYGVRELLWTKDNATATHAVAARDMKLEQVKYPVPVISQTSSKISKATIICNGWWDTLGWQYYANAGTTEVATSTQVETIITNEGEFFTGVDLDIASGIDTSEYRDGDANALFEVQQLLEMGTDNNLRMLASVTEHLEVTIEEETTKPVQPYLITSNGDWAEEYGQEIRKETCPVGVWARMKDVMPPSVDSSMLSDPSILFVEENEYIVDKDELNHIARGAPDPWEFPTVKDG